MAQTHKYKRKTWDAVKDFFRREERPHALDPETIASVTRNSERHEESEDDANVQRIHRITERRNIADSPNTTWPG